MKKLTTFSTTVILGLGLALSHTAMAQANEVTESTAPTSALSETATSPLKTLQHQWAHINYELDDAEKEKAFVALINTAKSFVKAEPNNPELLIWQGIIQSSTAGAKGGRLDENALSGSAMTSLGVLYHKLPGWPISFGNDKKAEKLLKHALEINPDGIDPNYFYAEYLFDNGKYEQALKFAKKALDAPARADRPIADSGRKREIALLEAKIARKS